LEECDQVLKQLVYTSRLLAPDDEDDELHLIALNDDFMWLQCPESDDQRRDGASTGNTGLAQGTIETHTTTPVEDEPLELKVFHSMIITHVVIGRVQNPNDEEVKPFVYATVAEDNNIIWRTYVASVKPDCCRVFLSKDGADIATAARERREDLEVC
jgi:hypothetical protein